MRRALSAAAAAFLLVFAACETEPPTDVTYKSATLHGQTRCQAQPPVYDSSVQFELRKDGGDWAPAGPVHPYHCENEAGIKKPIADTPVSDLDHDSHYEYRLRNLDNGKAYDQDGTENGTNYDSFDTAGFPTVTPGSATELSHTIGINTRTGFNGTNYDCFNPSDDDCAKVKWALGYLGVKRIRDGIKPAGFAQQHNFYDDLSATTDVKLRFGISSMPDGLPYINEQLALVDSPTNLHETRLRNLVSSFESVNEPDYYSPWALCNDGLDNDSWGDETRAANDSLQDYPADPQCASAADESEKLAGVQTGPTWGARTRIYQQRLFERVRANPLFDGKQVVGVSYANGGEPNVGDLGPWVDMGNFHPYPGEQKPGYQGNNLSLLVDRCKQYAGGKPCAATEFGYFVGPGGVNEDVRAAYTLRLVFEHWTRGVRSNDFYNLVEQWPDNSANCVAATDGEVNTVDFGWFDCHWNPKPVAVAVKRFTETLGDGAPPLAPLAYSVDAKPTATSIMAFQRGDGKYVLTIWRDVSLWNAETDTPVSVVGGQVRITLPDAESVEDVRPVHQDSQIRQNGDQWVVDNVKGDPVLLVVTPEP